MRKLKKIAVNPVIVELSDKASDTYMQLDMCILTNATNLNKAQFTDDFIDGVVENKEKYIGIPLVGSRDKLEKGKYKNLTHEYNAKTKQLNTDIIGSFTDFWKDESDGVSQLMGSVRVLKRYPNVCSAIKELHENDELRFSCEVLVYFYGEEKADGTRTIPYADGENTNSLFASAVVSNPAEVRSTATLLIAEAMEKDLGGEGVPDFNKGNEIRFHIESASIKIEQISNQIYSLLNPMNPRTESRDYRYWIRDLYNDKVVVGDWNNYETYWLINYSVENDAVVLEDESKWVEGAIGFIPKSVDVNSLLAETHSLQAELDNQNEEVQKQMKTVEELQAEVDALMPYKEKVEIAEKEAKKTSLVDKYSKILSEETMKSEEVKSAIEELNETKLNEIVVSEVVKQKVVKVTSGKDVVVAATNADDLVPQDRKTRMYAPKQ